jgi:hypothetical protein
MALVRQRKATGMPEHVWVSLEAQRGNRAPARSTIRAKPAVVNGAPRSEVNTNGDLGSCSRASVANHNLERFKLRGSLRALVQHGPLRLAPWRPSQALRIFVFGLAFDDREGHFDV